MAELAFHVARALHLIALSFAPGWLHPDPRPEPAEGAGAFALVILAALGWATARWGRHVATGLLAVAVLSALGASALRKDTPLVESVPFVAPWIWGTLAAAIATRVPRHKRSFALGTMLVGAAVIGQWALTHGERRKIWAETLARDPSHAVALSGLGNLLLAEKKSDNARLLADACLDRTPESCVCLELRARALLSGESPSRALDLRGLGERCGTRGAAQALLAHAFAVTGDVERAREAADKARALGGTSDAELFYFVALANERAGNFAEAEAEAERAVAAGAGRDALLLLGAVRIARGDLKRAADALDELLKQDPSDVEAAFNRALVYDRLADYNGARQGYLAVLRIRPQHIDARYNLALLTLRAGVKAEARHHAERFIEAAPQDPRRKALESAVGIAH
jgi:tetratricopeptide (TPR) repeat protein